MTRVRSTLSVTLLLVVQRAFAEAALLPSREEAVEIFADIAAERASERLLTELGVDGGSRLQNTVPIDRPFPCKFPRSNAISATPKSVHRLRPQDISVVATMGDSLVTGFGALAETVVGLFFMDQKVSWSIGGDQDWRSVTTIPNLLRMFNPNLIGYAVEGSNNHFGMGEAQSHDEHLLGQAKRLVAKLKSDPRVDFKRHWKMVTILSGQNDICSGDPCFPSPKAAALEHKENLRKALDYLQINSPRTFVNLLPVIDVTAGWKIEKSILCGVMSVIECRCLYGPGGAQNVKKLKEIVDAYHFAERQLISSGRYDTKEDFVVVLQPFTSKLEPPKSRNFLGFNLADLSLFSVDCFHLSQKGHAAFATMQWNNLLQPEGNKTMDFMMPMQRMTCPSERAPYFFTNANSKSYLKSGRQ
ncbi:phospholipase B1, membrane-associated-like [Neocloeon triangulifer]|uniref:phospholipase B1, membrane-associated-like n=1 Tax=Neocloeon triangulifer TaxID=2078957 RepID=UPI00286F384D|nr:phospholipase B1, membrane-associated-like [Neocloeon triangulifer]